jgi:hypothetical protein
MKNKNLCKSKPKNYVAREKGFSLCKKREIYN